MNTIIYFVRHADSTFIRGKEESRELSEKGWLDVEKITEILLNEPIDIIVSSPYKRAVQTISHLADSLDKEILFEPRLRERTLASEDYVFQNHHAAVEYAFTLPTHRYPGGESNEDAKDRGIEAIKELVETHRGEGIVVGTHGNIMVCILNYFCNKFSYEFWKRTSMPDIYKLTINSELQLESWKRLWR